MSYIGKYKDRGYIANGEVMAWVFKHCPSYITNDTIATSDSAGDLVYYYRFYFGDENDLFLFNLRWTT